MKIAIIGCPFWGTIYGPNYTLGILSALTKKAGHEPVIFDLNIELYNQVAEEDKNIYWDYDNHTAKYNKLDILFKKYRAKINNIIDAIIDEDVALLAFSVTMFSSQMSIKINQMIRERSRNLISVFGGVDCFEKQSALSFLNEKNINMVCNGEAETCLHEMLDAVEMRTWERGVKGFLIKTYDNEIIDGGSPEICKDMDSIPFPDYSGFNRSIYTEKNKYTTQFSRGCINRCAFCYEHKIHKKYRFRSSSNVVDELKMILKETRLGSIYINFADSLLNGSIKELEKFCDSVIEEGISVSWWGQAFVRKEMTKEILVKMKNAGCSGLSWGIETGSDHVLKLMNKRTNISLIKKVIRDSYEIGILQNTNFIMGFPGETEEDFLETCNFIIDNRKYFNSIGTTLLSIEKAAPIYVNSENYNIIDRDKRIDWETKDGINTLQNRLNKDKIAKTLIGTKYYGAVKTDFTITDPFLDSLSNRAYNAIMQLLEEDKIKVYDKIVLYGTGEWGKRFKNILDLNGIQVSAFLDSDSAKWDKEYLNIKIVDPNKILSLIPDCKVIIASSANRPISLKLEELSFQEDKNYFGFKSIS